MATYTRAELATYKLDQTATEARKDANKAKRGDIPLDAQLALWDAHRAFFGPLFELCRKRWELAYPKYRDSTFWYSDRHLERMLDEERADALNYAFMLIHRYLLTDPFDD